MKTPSGVLVLFCVVILLCSPASARSIHNNNNGLAKRVSDQRLAELETILEMMSASPNRKFGGQVGFGLIDPYAIGRRKRAGVTSPSRMRIDRLLPSTAYGQPSSISAQFDADLWRGRDDVVEQQQQHDVYDRAQ